MIKIFIYITKVRLYTRCISNLKLTPDKNNHQSSNIETKAF
jgi:hypothetical protein